jgi:hypothetical protein
MACCIFVAGIRRGGYDRTGVFVIAFLEPNFLYALKIGCADVTTPHREDKVNPYQDHPRWYLSGSFGLYIVQCLRAEEITRRVIVHDMVRHDSLVTLYGAYLPVRVWGIICDIRDAW